jgi:uncharacterized membrane protein YphA (DoxX/SURF4 family)
MDIALRIVQVLLAVIFLVVGFAKAFRYEQFVARPNSEWARDLGRTPVRVIGLLEIAGATGLIAPAATGILPWLTPLAAAGLAATMVGAVALNLRRGETRAIPQNVVLGAMSALVAVGLLAAGLA